MTAYDITKKYKYENKHTPYTWLDRVPIQRDHWHTTIVKTSRYGLNLIDCIAVRVPCPSWERRQLSPTIEMKFSPWTAHPRTHTIWRTDPIGTQFDRYLAHSWMLIELDAWSDQTQGLRHQYNWKTQRVV